MALALSAEVRVGKDELQKGPFGMIGASYSYNDCVDA